MLLMPMRYTIGKWAMMSDVSWRWEITLSGGFMGTLMNVVELNAPTLIRKRIEADRASQSSGRFDFAKNVTAPALAKAFNAKRIWLFGSTARNDATSDSDIDLLVEGGLD